MHSNVILENLNNLWVFFFKLLAYFLKGRKITDNNLHLVGGWGGDFNEELLVGCVLAMSPLS